MIVSHVGLWLVTVFLALAVFALMRQVGLLHRRISPTGARMTTDGPAIGDEAPRLDAVDIQGRQVVIGVGNARMALLVFVSPACSVCAELLPAVRSIWRTERRRMDVVILSTGTDVSLDAEYVTRHKLEAIPYVVSPAAVQSYRVMMPPYAVVIGGDGRIKAKGMANHFEHLESLLTAARLGHPTIESYMAGQETPVRPATSERTRSSSHATAGQASA